MLHLFRQAAGLTQSRYNRLFKYISDLPRIGLDSSDNVVFIDDFSGTGTQILNSWTTIRELVGDKPNLFLLLIAAPDKTVQSIEDNTAFTVRSDRILTEGDNIFSKQCRYFNTNEKAILEYYCKKASKKEPKGFGGCGLLIVFHHGCPNNSIPILHANNNKWSGLFKRYDFASRKNL